jgi:hypothetical protein
MASHFLRDFKAMSKAATEIVFFLKTNAPALQAVGSARADAISKLTTLRVTPNLMNEMEALNALDRLRAALDKAGAKETSTAIAKMLWQQ